MFVFKMFKVGPGSGVHLVNRMQPGGDLEHTWIMFDHVVATQDRVFSYYVPNSPIKHSKSDSKDRSQEIL
jgi:hypothetical protein